MIENHIRDAGNRSMTRHGDYRNRYGMLEQRVDCDNSLGAAPNEHSRVFLDKTLLATMVSSEIEVSGFDELIANSDHLLRVLTVAEFRHENSVSKLPPIVKYPPVQ